MTSDTKGLDKRFLQIKSIYDIDNKLLGYTDAYNDSDKIIAPVGLKKGGSVNKMMYGGMAKKKMMHGGHVKKSKK